MYSLVTPSLACQSPVLSVVSPANAEYSSNHDKEPVFELLSLDIIIDELLALDTISLQILELIGKSDGITAKVLGQKINLSRYAALKRAQKLVGKKFARLEEVSSAKTGIKPTYVFRLVKPLTLELISEAILYRVQEQELQKNEDWFRHFEPLFEEALDRTEELRRKLKSQSIICLKVLRTIVEFKHSRWTVTD